MSERAFAEFVEGRRAASDPPSSSVALIRRADGAFLLNLRDDLPTIAHPGAWSFLGGGCEIGETPVEALRRELWEEAEIVLESESAAFSVVDEEGSGDRIDVFECVPRTADEDMRLHEGQELGYLQPEQLDAVPTPPFVRDVIQEALRRQNVTATDAAHRPPAHLIGASFPARNPASARAIWSSFPIAVREAAIGGAAAGLVFALIKPDAVVEAKQWAILEAIESEGIRVIDLEPTSAADRSRFEDLYRYNLTVNNEQNMMSTWWLNRRVFETGIGIAVLLMVPDSVRGDIDGGSYFARLKGPSDPLLTGPGELRHRFSAVNTSLNLVHGSDDGLTAVRESLIFFGHERVLRALTTVESVSTVWRRVLLSSIAGSGVDLDPALTAIRLRIAVAVSDRRARSIETVAALSELDEAVSVQPTVDRLSTALSVLREREATAPEVRSPFARIASSVPLLSMDHSDARRFLAAVEAAEVAVSPWQRLTLETSAFYGQMTARISRTRG